MHISKPDKHLKGDKNNSSVLIVVALTTVIVVFCLISAKALLAQGAYQRRVVNAKHDTVKQLEDNIEAAQTLSKQYDVFESANPNALGGKSDVADGTPPPDGKNSRIVLDALPTSYDFPALISSLSKLLTIHNISGANIGGSDQSGGASDAPSANPKPLTIQSIPLSGGSSYAVVQALVKDLERSTRPYDITSIQFSGNDATMTINLTMSTYYQPTKTIVLESKEVK